MSLMRLLAAGRSLMGGDDRSNRYRLPRRHPMPHFGGDANPFASTVRPGGGRENAAEPPGATEAPAASTPPAQPAPAAKPSAKRGWLARLNPFRGRTASATTPLPPVRHSPRPATAASALSQPELSLLAVQVVRNDLSDADGAPPRSRLKGRELLGRAFPRVAQAGFGLDDELAGDASPSSSCLPEFQMEAAAQAKLI